MRRKEKAEARKELERQKRERKKDEIRLNVDSGIRNGGSVK